MKTETKGHQGNHAAQRGQIHPRLESEQIPTRHGCSGPDWHPGNSLEIYLPTHRSTSSQPRLPSCRNRLTARLVESNVKFRRPRTISLFLQNTNNSIC
jgi:hypothetical protein